MRLRRPRRALIAGLTGLALLAPAVPASSTEVESEGCSAPTTQAAGTSAKRTLASGGLERSYVVHLPKKYHPRKQWPVVVAFHGRGSTGTELEGFSGLSRLPAIVAYPNGVVGEGDDGRQAWQGAPYSASGVDDVAFAEDLLDDIGGAFCADPQRTYATGKSNGGGLAHLLSCRLPDRFAAVAPVAAALYPGTREGCATSTPVPTLLIHGTNDVTIPYSGDEERELPAITDWTAEVAAKASCRVRPKTTVLAHDAVWTTYRKCSADTEHVAVLGGGHTWPGADAYSGGGYTSQQIEATDLAWSFFKGHSTAETTSGGTS